ncbi:hypothetical protein M4951_09260 [Blastopirellula sp. J2-11]|uniref:hypothetical protein n=1 Tax=Blastopirellula sp. J2-11 TaxID=2943192 RepID=UPI0021C80F4F|nr:hypothetical protein [Blastopirellula sp. J2-11]UUO08490.1 hypothetical protein M4951_09260 [Blastopirellula sp. J2-11]
MANNRSYASATTAIAGVIVSVIYLSNITMGIFEIPDNLPFVGNLDEVFFSGVLFASLAHLGINLPVGQRRVTVDANKKKEDASQQPGE